MKEINIKSAVQAYKNLTQLNCDNFFKYFDIYPKKDELIDLESFVGELEKLNIEVKIYDNYFFGYTIPQISKEFDLLRIGEGYVINIELKRENTGEKIKYQLVKNKYYLNFLEKEIYNFTYISNENQLYSIDNNENLVKKDFNELIGLLKRQKIEKNLKINSLFNPSNYLVSPFNSTTKFIKGEFFLTSQQEQIKKDTIQIVEKEGFSFTTICGKSGTGKTLLAYEIVKHFINKKERVLIVHCGIENDGHKKLKQKYFWEIISIRYLIQKKVSDYSLILIDEAQRIRPYQLENITKEIKQFKGNCIFSYDEKQCLKTEELDNNIGKLILDTVSPNQYTLKGKIRSNSDIASFTNALFNKANEYKKLDKSNIELNFFNNYKDAKSFIKILKKQDWKIINYTPSNYTVFPYDNYHINGEDSTHNVIGQEFEKVVVVIDSHFYYEGNNLSTRNYRNKPLYHPTQMLYQIITRAIKKLYIIVIGNEEVMERCLYILS